MKKMLFVMNPYSGQRRANRYLAEIIDAFNRADYEVRCHMTAGPGDAVKVVAEAKDCDLVVCCGGDGTFNETISGLISAGLEIPVGYIPAGSTNDFANSLRLNTDVMGAVHDILNGVPVSYDAGIFNGRYFSYVASFGAFTQTSYNTPQNIKNALGHTAYVLEGISELSQIHPQHIRMEADDELIEGDFLFGAICNSTSVGGILTLDPNVVDMCDGRMEILLVRAPQSLVEVAECIQAVQTQKYNCAMMTFRSAKNIRMIADPDMPWTLDGEREDGHKEITVHVQHQAYCILQNKEK